MAGRRSQQQRYKDLLEAHSRAEEEAKHFRSLIENAPHLISIIDESGTIRYVNPAHKTLLDYRPEDLVGKSVFEFVHPEDLASVQTSLANGLNDPGRSSSVEVRFRHRDGSWRNLAATGTMFADPNGQLLGTVNSQDVTAQKRAERQTKVLLEVTKLVSSTLNRDELLERVQRQVVEGLPCDRIATFCFDAARNAFRLAAQYGVPSDLVPQLQELAFPPGQPFDGLVLDGKTLVINDMTKQLWLPPALYQRFGIAAFVAAPLRVRDRHFGLMLAANATPGHAFDPEQVRLLEGIAREVGVAIENAELYHAQQSEAEVAVALARIGREAIGFLQTPALLNRLSELAVEVLSCDASTTCLWRLQDDTFVPVSHSGLDPDEWDGIRLLKIPRTMDFGLMPRLEREEVVQIIPPDPEFPVATALHHRYGFRTMVCMALRRGGRIFGFQTAGYRNRSEPFSAHQLRIARGFAQIASLALDRVRVIEELEQTNRMKSDFVATMSHELRTPLNVILGYNDLLREAVFGDLTTEQLDVLDRMGRNARELLELVNSTLDFSRIEAGRLPIEVGEVVPSQLLEEIDTEIREAVGKPSVEFTCQISPEVPVLHTDAAKLKVILKNLASNAFKFTKRGEIRLEVAPYDHGVRFSVADTGIGIGPEDSSVIFEPFHRGASWFEQHAGGTGLGLYIVRRLTEILGGRVTLDSALGRGSTFHVWLPIRLRSPHAAPERNSTRSG
jgi:PAS domain S-box-containing protein